jgi:hypothetical protein
MTEIVSFEDVQPFGVGLNFVIAFNPRVETRGSATADKLLMGQAPLGVFNSICHFISEHSINVEFSA